MIIATSQQLTDRIFDYAQTMLNIESETDLKILEVTPKEWGFKIKYKQYFDGYDDWVTDTVEIYNPNSFTKRIFKMNKYTLNNVPRTSEGWININDLLPEFSKDILVVFDGSVYFSSFQSKIEDIDGIAYRFNIYFLNGDYTTTSDIVYWQPIPDLPNTSPSKVPTTVMEWLHWADLEHRRKYPWASNAMLQCETDRIDLPCSSLISAVYQFKDWDSTIEKDDFWTNVIKELENELLV